MSKNRDLNEDMSVLQDQIEGKGEISRLCDPGDLVVVYTSTFAYRGTVSRVSSMIIELEDPEILMPVGDHQSREKGSDDWEGLNAEKFAHSTLRIPAFGIALFVLN